jgi:1-phosphofructokinase family hexose kinase
MILTITLNPLLERRFVYQKVDLGSSNRGGGSALSAGGKGINVSRQLNNLDVQNHAFTFAGGNNGKILRDNLSKENINFSFVKTTSETRDAAIIYEKSSNSISTFFSSDPIINKNEVEEFKQRLEKMIQNCQIVVFSGSSSCDETNSIVPFGIDLANKFDKISICDVYGKQLKNCIKSKPAILHNNVTELENSLGISLKSESEILNFLDTLYRKGIKQAFITDGKKPGYALTFGFKYKIENPEINPIDETGSGDSFVAGIAYCLHHNLTFDETLKTSASLGIANAQSYETSNVKFDEMKKYFNAVKISSIGKKMKTLDVTPI